MKKIVLALLVLPLMLGDAYASEPPGDPAPIPGARYEGGRPTRGYIPPPRYSEPPPRYYEPAPRYEAPRVRLGDICVIEDSRSGRSCDLRRPQPINAYCECISPNGRVREGRVSR